MNNVTDTKISEKTPVSAGFQGNVSGDDSANIRPQYEFDAKKYPPEYLMIIANNIHNFATKTDVADLRSEMHEKFGEFSEKIGEIKGEIKALHQKIEGIENKLESIVYKIIGGCFVSICIAAGGIGAFMIMFT